MRRRYYRKATSAEANPRVSPLRKALAAYFASHGSSLLAPLPEKLHAKITKTLADPSVAARIREYEENENARKSLRTYSEETSV